MLKIRIEKLRLISGANEARGLAVIIDVFRACTTAAYVLANGAERIVPVGGLEEAFEMRRRHPDWVLMGERDGERVEGFDYDNSPFEIRDVDFSGRTVIFTTAAGTQGIVNAAQADEVLLGSFVTAGAIVKYVRRVQPRVLSLVAMGDSGVKPNVEDELFAEYIDDTLKGKYPDFEGMRRRIRASPSGSKFFDKSLPQYHEEDFQMALDLDRFDFILRGEKDDGLSILKETE